MRGVVYGALQHKVVFDTSKLRYNIQHKPWYKHEVTDFDWFLYFISQYFEWQINERKC